jgi:Circadian oscillating protein COP23
MMTCPLRQKITMKNRYPLALLCFLGIIFLKSPTTQAAEVDFTLTFNPSTPEIPSVGGEASQPIIVQIIESPSVEATEGSTDLVIESPSVEAPESSIELVIESPSVSPLLPQTVAEAEGYTLARKKREKQNIEQYQASLLAEEESAQEPVLEETLSAENEDPIAVESPAVSYDVVPVAVESPAVSYDVVPAAVESPAVFTEEGADIPLFESSEEPVLSMDKPYENSASNQVRGPVNSSAQKVDLAALTFQCNKRKSIPATIAKIQDSGELLLILWSSDFFKPAGYNAQVRCNQVSARFAAYSKDASPIYLMTGKMNGQPVICLTSKDDGRCGEGISLSNGLLFTLKPTDDSQQILKNLVSLLQSKTASDRVRIEQ